ncbi:MAG: hypothetical protein WC494_02920 [Candidatus Pacearchaeota archaeon]
MKEVFARAPSRIDFAGGTLDLDFFIEKEKGATLNCAVAKYGYSTLKPNNRFLEIDSVNYNKKMKVNFPIEYNGELDLLKALFKITDFKEKGTLTAYHEVAPHSRLGTSSSISVSVLGAILRAQRKKIDKIKIVNMATIVEKEELHMDNGPQDQYAAALGGILMLRYKGRKVRVEQLKLKKDIIYELEKNFVLCVLNSEKVAGNVNHETVKGYMEGNERVISSIKNIKQITFDMYKSLKKGNLSDFAELLNQENSNREKLNKYIVTPNCKKFLKLGKDNGAIAGKILGSGAGTLLFYAGENKRSKLVNALEKNRGKILDFRFDFDGLQTWEK